MARTVIAWPDTYTYTYIHTLTLNDRRPYILRPPEGSTSNIYYFFLRSFAGRVGATIDNTYFFAPLTYSRTRVRAVFCVGGQCSSLGVRVRQGLRDEGTKAMPRHLRIWKAMFDYIAQHLEGQVRAHRRRDAAIKRILLIPFGALPACAARE